MIPRLRAGLCLCLLICLQNVSVCARAQTAPAEPETILRSELLGQQLVLRDMSAATSIHGSWDGHAASLDPPLWHILAVLNVHKIRLKGSELTLEATRNQIVRNEIGKLGLSSLATPVNITLTLEGGPASLAPTLRDAVFFPSIDAALAVPKAFEKEIPPQAGVVHKASTPQPACDCADTTGTCHAVKSSGMKPPKLLSGVAPQLSEIARLKRIDGSVEVGIRLDDTGAIADEWLVRELDDGLDEPAVIAVSQYKFSPATCHGKAVGADLFVDVNFH